MSGRACLYCRIVAVKGPRCVNCDRVFHPKCLERLNDVKVVNPDEVVCCESVGSKSGGENTKNEENVIIAFLESDRFKDILKSSLNCEIIALKEEVNNLRDEVKILKESNIDLIKLLTARRIEGPSIVTFESPIGSKADNVKMNKNNSKSTFAELFTNGEKKKSEEVHKNVTVKPRELKNLDKLNGTNINIEPKKFNDPGVNEWVEVKRKNRMQRSNQGIRGKADSCQGLSAAVKKISLYAGNFAINTEADKICDHLKVKFPGESINVEILPKREEALSLAFKITLNESLQDRLYDENLWPNGVVVRRFFRPKIKRAQIDQ